VLLVDRDPHGDAVASHHVEEHRVAMLEPAQSDRELS
jgi:hypothetical protein